MVTGTKLSAIAGAGSIVGADTIIGVQSGTTDVQYTVTALSAKILASPTITGHAVIEGVTATGATGTGAFVFATSPTLVTPTLGVATATSVAIGGATIGSNALAVTGTANISGNTTVGGTLLMTAANPLISPSNSGLNIKGASAGLTYLSVMPNGTQTARNAIFQFFNTDYFADSTNFENFGLYAIGASGYQGVSRGYTFGSQKGGTGTARPILLGHWASGDASFATVVAINADGTLGFGGTGGSTDANISRNAAGVLQVGTTAANASGSLALVGISMSGFITGSVAAGTNSFNNGAHLLTQNNALFASNTTYIDGSTGQTQTYNNGMFGFASGSSANGSVDTNISRNSAGAIQFGTTAKNASGAWLAAKGTLTGGTLADQAQVLSITATQPTTPTGNQIAIRTVVTGAGNASQTTQAQYHQYAAGYTGSSTTLAVEFENDNAGTASTLLRAAGSNFSFGNIGFQAETAATTTGLNIGGSGWAEGGNINVGLIGGAQKVKNSATNIGVVGSAINTGSSPVHIGGFFSLNQTTVPTVSAAAIFDNGSQTDAIALFRDNASTVLTVADGGGVSGTGSYTFTVAASGIILKQGANGRVGTFVLNGATPVTVNNTSIAITDAIIISLNTVGGTVGAHPAILTITASTGFTVAGTALDTSTYNYVIIKNAA